MIIYVHGLVAYWPIFILLFQEGVILVGGNSTSDTNISLNALAAKQQSIVGIPQGNINQLIELLNAVADNKVSCLELFCFRKIITYNMKFDTLCTDTSTTTHGLYGAGFIWPLL